MTMESLVSLSISIVAMIVSVLALICTAKTYLLKSGASIRGSYSICSSISCQDKYVGSISLENVKDRAVVVFKIYLRLGHNYFVEIDDFEGNPLILKPFEVFRKEYDPIDLYSVSAMRILINDLLDKKRVRRRIVLSTSGGKYTVRAGINHWDPVIDFFKNHLTAIVRPMRSTYKGKAYGGNAKFIVGLKMENGKEEVIPIYPRDYQMETFNKFRLTKASLESKEALEEFLYDKAGEGILNCVDIEVHDLASWRDEVYKMEDRKVIRPPHYSWFMYYVVGPILTKSSNYRLRTKNKAMQKERAGCQTKPHR